MLSMKICQLGRVELTLECGSLLPLFRAEACFGLWSLDILKKPAARAPDFGPGCSAGPIPLLDRPAQTLGRWIEKQAREAGA
jgi:hypothetical protein